MAIELLHIGPDDTVHFTGHCGGQDARSGKAITWKRVFKPFMSFNSDYFTVTNNNVVGEFNLLFLGNCNGHK